ncbi:MAG TPA: hypothetical protein VEL76_37915 [Gemmataceae bacterium]|nr:hypothetical protein [Gemmataceae bacterium]
MHSFVLVLVSDPTAKVFDQVDDLIGRHSDYAEVEPYKEYFEPCSWDGREWGEEDAEEFMRRREQMYGEKYGRDDKGYYQWRNTNRDGHYDWYSLGGRWDGVFAGMLPDASDEVDGIGDKVRGNICRVSEVPAACSAAAIVTPDGTWHEIWHTCGLLPLQEASPETLMRVKELLKPYGQYYAVVVDAHS